MKILKNKILEAINRGLNQALKFDLHDYDDSNSIYISKKKTDLNKEDKLIEIEYYNKLLDKFVQRLLVKLPSPLTNEEQKCFLHAINLGCKYTFEVDYFDFNYFNLVRLIKNYCSCFGWNSNLNWIDTKNIRIMSRLFADTPFNGDISEWVVSNVWTMEGMFDNATKFNLPIGNWDMSNVISISSMFRNAVSFNLPIGSWDLRKVNRMNRTFELARSFNLPIGDWNVSHVVDMILMFHEANSFNLPIGNWDVHNVETMRAMFDSASSFNQDISSWEFCKGTYDEQAFKKCPIKEKFKPISCRNEKQF